MTVEANAYNGLLTAFSNGVDEVLNRRDLMRYEGSEVLNAIQAEVNEFQMRTERVRSLPDVTMEQLQRDSEASLKRVRLLADDIQRRKFGANGLGEVETRLSIVDVPAWKTALKSVTSAIDSLGGRFARLIANSPDGPSIDENIAQTLRNMETTFHLDPSPAGAAKAQSMALAHLSNIESELVRRKQEMQIAELEYVVDKKNAEMNSLVSMLKMNESRLSSSDKAVIRKHNSEVVQLLARLKSDVRSYDRAIRQQRLDVIDTNLAVLRKLKDAVVYRSSIGGMAYTTPRLPSTKKHGWGNIPKRRYHEHQTANPPSTKGVRRPFDTAPYPRVRGVGLGNVGGNTQLKKTPRGSSGEISLAQGELVDLLNDNMMTAQAQGYVTPGDAAVLQDQTSGITIEAFGGDQQLFTTSKTTYLNTIKHLEQEYILKAQRGLIADMTPEEAAAIASGGSKIPEGYHKALGWGTRAGITLGGAALILIPTFLYVGFKLAEREARTVDVSKEAGIRLIRPKKPKRKAAGQSAGPLSGLMGGLTAKVPGLR